MTKLLSSQLNVAQTPELEQDLNEALASLAELPSLKPYLLLDSFYLPYLPLYPAYRSLCISSSSSLETNRVEPNKKPITHHYKKIRTSELNLLQKEAADFLKGSFLEKRRKYPK